MAVRISSDIVQAYVGAEDLYIKYEKFQLADGSLPRP
jgi:hypothetical protein